LDCAPQLGNGTLHVTEQGTLGCTLPAEALPPLCHCLVPLPAEVQAQARGRPVAEAAPQGLLLRSRGLTARLPTRLCVALKLLEAPTPLRERVALDHQLHLLRTEPWASAAAWAVFHLAVGRQVLRGRIVLAAILCHDGL